MLQIKMWLIMGVLPRASVSYSHEDTLQAVLALRMIRKKPMKEIRDRHLFDQPRMFCTKLPKESANTRRVVLPHLQNIKTQIHRRSGDHTSAMILLMLSEK